MPRFFTGTQQDDTLNGVYRDARIRMLGGDDDVQLFSIKRTTVTLGEGADFLEVQKFRGENVVFGGRGDDILKIGGEQSDFTILPTADGGLMIFDGESSQIFVRGFESILFDDGPLNSEEFVFTEGGAEVIDMENASNLDFI